MQQIPATCPPGYALDQNGQLCVGTPGNQTAPSCPAGYQLVNGMCDAGSGPAGGWRAGGGRHGSRPVSFRGNPTTGNPIIIPPPQYATDPVSPPVYYCTEGAGPGDPGCPGPVVNPVQPATPQCSGYYTLNQSGNACVLNCKAMGLLIDPTNSTCLSVCPAGYGPDPTNSFCTAIPTTVASTTTSTTTATGTLGSIETWVSTYWLYLALAAGVYFVFIRKKGR